MTDTPYDPATDPAVTAQDDPPPGTEPPKPAHVHGLTHSVDTEGDDDGEDGTEGPDDPPW